MIAAALDALDPALEDPIPADVRARRGLPDLRPALEAIHRPDITSDIGALNAGRTLSHRRFKFEEFFRFELALALRRHRVRSSDGIRFKTSDTLRSQIRKILPFRPTAAQKRAFGEIVADLTSDWPMSRLLQGDVGCGKTLVAFETVVVAVENGYQAALMVPTEILAEQHAINARRILGPLGYAVGLVRKGTSKDDPGLLAAIRAGDVPLVIGTHALLEEEVEFSRLGLVVIDEQHRFGVLQRMKLMDKGRGPNTLVMTATPIPRTLAMTFYGDLDVSSIDEMPPGREPIRTGHVLEGDRDRIDETIRREIEAGRQCYVVYPLVEESEKLDLRSAKEGHIRLSGLFGAERVGLLHGRLKSLEKEAVMQAFLEGALDVLVSTTVIEVGVDVPNATLIVIEHAERFGIAQLHQLRGRVGRGRHRSACLLVTSGRLGRQARERIRAVVQTTDGFRLSEEDLRLRGPGEFVGTRQSGLPEFRTANLIDDMDILTEARDEAQSRVEDPGERIRLVEALSRVPGIAGVVGVG
jgi:ATP-dependent DNA helicase RecG